MKLLAPTAIAAALIARVSAHTVVYAARLNDKAMGNDFIRMPLNNEPVKDLTSPDLMCNSNGSNPASSWLPFQAGDALILEWRTTFSAGQQDLGANTPPDQVVSESHHGPLSTYIAGACSNGEGPVWFKIQEEGYSDNSWATDKLRARGGDYPVVVPSDLCPGFYMLRAELIAYHEGDYSYIDNPARGIQVFPGCVQIEIIGNGTNCKTLPTDGVSIPGTVYTYTSPDVVFSLYDGTDPNSYKVVGPAITPL